MCIGGNDMQVLNLYSGSWLSNCYVLISNDSNGSAHAAVVDPSAPTEKILDALKKHNAKLDMIIMTHGHFDHIISLDELRRTTGATVLIHRDDNEMLSDSMKNAYSFFFGGTLVLQKADRLLEDGDAIRLGTDTLKVMHLPGHSKGSIALLCDGMIITGDTLFAEGFGRYDLYGGDLIVLKNSLKSLRTLDKSLTVYAGHGENARLGRALDAISYFLD